MPTTLTVHDETSSGQKTHSFTLECLTERMTVRELIRARIYQEVQDYNTREPEYFRSLVEPTQAERTLKWLPPAQTPPARLAGTIPARRRSLRAQRLFRPRRQPQAERLDDDFEVKVDTEVSFVKLVPLVGGVNHETAFSETRGQAAD